MFGQNIIDSEIIGMVFAMILFMVLYLFFFASRYKKFKSNEYIIHLRNGKIRSVGLGGHVIKIPIIDEIVVIPTTTRKTIINASKNVLSRENQNLKVVAIICWKIIDPTVAYNAVDLDPQSRDYIENILNTSTEAIIRTLLASLEIEKIIHERKDIIKMVSDQLNNLTKDWGIVIESLEIIELEVLNNPFL